MSMDTVSMKQTSCFCTQDIFSFAVSSSLQGRKNKGKRTGSKHSVWEHHIKQHPQWVQESGSPSATSQWPDCSLTYATSCMVLESMDYFGSFWPASQKAFYKSRHWEQAGALDALRCWRHPLLRLGTCLQVNFLGSLLLENQKKSGMVWNYFSSFHMIWSRLGVLWNDYSELSILAWQ